MKDYIRAWPEKAEFATVILVAFGYFIGRSLFLTLHPHSEPQITGSGLRAIIVYEIIVLVTLGWFLTVRGWSLAKIGFQPSMRDVGDGVVLAIVAYLAYALAYILAVAGGLPAASHQGVTETGLAGTGLGLATLISVSMINPVFEEIFVCGYVITMLKESRGFWFAISTSIAIRMAYHLYAGPLGVITILPLGLLFGYRYAKTGRLWPVVVAHAIFDFWTLVT